MKRFPIIFYRFNQWVSACSIDYPRFVSQRLLLCVCLFWCAGVFANANENLTEMDLEDLLGQEVKTASKIAAQVSQSPSAVSIVTAKDIQSYGYRTLAEVINSMRGLNTTSDHVYTYMSGRGFGRPGDYPGRVMLLIDGHQANDNLYNASYLGQDGLLDTELIERVEYVSGPGSVIYGNGAFYGIINVITKKGRSFDGAQVALEAYSRDGYKSRLTYGNKLANGADILLSASGYRSRGEDYYFSAFDSPASNFGVANNLDEERNHRLFMKFNYANWSLEAAYVDRTKDDPAAGYGTDFNAKPNHMRDTNAFINLSHEASLSDDHKNVSKLYYGHYGYAARNLYSGELYQEDNLGRWWGVESKFVYTGFAQHQLVYGVEYRNDYQQDFYFPDANIENSMYMASLYLQDEYRWSTQWAVNVGARADYGGNNAKNISPRLALIYSPNEKTDIKASYATAFRRPNAYEKYYEDGSTQLANPDVNKERIAATELVLEYRPDTTSKWLGSIYYYQTKDYIGVTDSMLSPGLLQAANWDGNQTKGLDIEYEKKWASATRLRASYAWQHATEANGRWIVNSPKNLAKINLAHALFNEKLHIGLEVQHVGERHTEDDNHLGSYTLTNLTLHSKALFKNTTISASVKNLFNKHYSVPAPSFYRPDSFEQDQQNLWLQLSYDFK
jgi:outer membrane receptor protein involved in Fe transport